MNILIDFVINKPKLVLCFLVLMTIVFGYGLSQIEVQNTMDGDLPEDDPMVVTKEKIEEIFGRKDIILIGVQTDDIFTYSTLSKIKALEEDLKTIKGVIPDETVSIVSVNNITGNNDGVDVGVFMPEIPTSRNELNKLKESALNNEMIVERIISKDGTFSAIIANIEDGYSQEYVYEMVLDIVAKYETPEKIYASGDPIQEKEIELGINGDVRLLLPLALLLLLFMYFFMFRTNVGLFLPFSVVILSLIWTMGFMGLAGYKINVVTSALPILMIVISGSYGIHYMQKFYENYSKNGNVVDARASATKLMFKPIMFTGITSAVGTFTLVVFRITSIQEFGIVASAGILLTFISCICSISVMLWLLRNKSIKNSMVANHKLLNFVLDKLALISLRYNKTILILSGALLLISVYGISKVEIGNNFIEYFPKNHSIRTTYYAFEEDLGGARYIDIMFEGDEPDAVKTPHFLNNISSFLEYAHSFDYVGNTFSVADVIKRMNKELHNSDEDYYTIPNSQDEIAQYLLLYGMSGNPGEFNSLIDYDYQRTKVRMMLNSCNQSNHIELYNALNDFADKNFTNMKVEFGGEVMFWLAQVDYIVRGKVQNLICAILIVLLLCSLVFRSLKYGLIGIIPLLVASLFTFGVMGFIGLRLETATAIITSIGIGIGVDFAIHYITAIRREIRQGKDFDFAVKNVINTTGVAITLDVITNIVGFTIFLFSGFVPLQQFGWLISLTMIGTSLGTLLMLPAFIKALKINK